MELIKLSQAIQSKIEELRKGRQLLKDRAEQKAIAMADYDRSLAIIILKLKNGVPMEFEGEKVVNPPVSVIEKIAKGMCWNQKLEKEKAEASYKAGITSMESLKAELNGLQSINRYLEEK